VAKPDTDLPLSRPTSVDGAPSGSCPIGKWVTVTRADGWVPSTSIAWAQASSRVKSAFATVFSPHDAQARTGQQ
jgi:hypothetical protein